MFFDSIFEGKPNQQLTNYYTNILGLGESKDLRPIYEAHKEAVSSLQALISRLGGTPCEDSGAWGTWAEIIQGSANLLLILLM